MSDGFQIVGGRREQLLVHVAIRMTKGMHVKLTKIAKENSTAVGDVIRQFVEYGLGAVEVEQTETPAE